MADTYSTLDEFFADQQHRITTILDRVHIARRTRRQERNIPTLMQMEIMQRIGVGGAIGPKRPRLDQLDGERDQ